MRNEGERVMQVQKKERKTKNVVGEYLFFIDYYVAKKEWVEHTKHITANKKEVERKLEDFWEERQEVRKFKIYQNIDYEKMKRETQEIVKKAFNTDVVAKNIRYYVIPLDKKNIIAQIESNTEGKKKCKLKKK